MLFGLDSGHALTTRITTDVIDAAAARHLVFRAAGVADERGRVVALVGGSGAGKTTAAQHLTRKSFGYVTDETVSCTPNGEVMAFPRPLASAPPGVEGDPKTPISPDALELRPCVADLKLTRIVLLDRHDGVTTPTLTDVGLLDAVLELIPQVSALARRPNPLQKLCRLIDRCGGLVRLTYGEADQIDGVIRELLGSPATPSRGWTPLSEPSSHAWHLMDGRVRRGPRRDAIETDDGEALLLIDRTPVRLSPIGLTIWLEAGEAPRPAELVARVLAEHGPHPDAEKIVRDAVASMVDAGVLGLDQPWALNDHVASDRDDVEAEPAPPMPVEPGADATG